MTRQSISNEARCRWVTGSSRSSRNERAGVTSGGETMRKIQRGLMLVIVVVTGTLPARAADVAAGKAKATEICAACHGENGVSQMENIPSLAGQPDQYIQWQLVYFRAGTRKNDQMQPIVAELSNDDIRNLGPTTTRTFPKKVHKQQSGGAARRVTPIISREPRPSLASPLSARNIS